MKQTKVSKALLFLKDNPGATAYAAAKHAKCSPATVYAKLNADKAKLEGVCPQCGAGRWRLIQSDDLPEGTPVSPGTVLYTFADHSGHWEYWLPKLPK